MLRPYNGNFVLFVSFVVNNSLLSQCKRSATSRKSILIFVNFVSFVVKFSYGKIAATTSSRLRCTCASSVIPQVTATWQARRGAMPSLINRPA